MSRQAHRAIYAKIPQMKCKEGCSDCCGPVPVTEWEAKRLGISGPLTPTKPGTIECAFVGERGECTVYDKRPFMCRLFGTAHDPHLTCPHGKCPSKMLSGNEAASLTCKYLKIYENDNRSQTKRAE